MSKTTIGALALAALVAAGGAFYLLNSDDEDNKTGGTTANGEAPGIYYVEGNVLKEAGPGESDGTELAEGLSAAADRSPGGDYLAWVAYAGPTEPITHIYTFGEEGVKTVPGDDPTWNADGSSLAVVKPVGKTKCAEADCKGPVEVFTVNPENGKAKEILNVGEWKLLGWADDRLVVGDATKKDVSFFVDGKNELTEFELPFGQVRSISPDASWIVTQKATGPELWSIDGDTAQKSDDLGTDDTTLTSVSWTGDSSRAAAISITLEKSTVVTFETDRPVLEPVTDLEPTGNVYWAPDEEGIIFTVVNRDDLQLEATYCPLGGGDCTTYVTWKTGTRVVGPVETE